MKMSGQKAVKLTKGKTIQYHTVQYRSLLNDTHDVRGAKFLLVVRLVLLTALLNPLMCFVTFLECNL